MPTMTIQEALATVKTINKRIEKKRAAVNANLWRQDAVRDPLEKDGGSQEFIRRERQAIGDLEEEIVSIRTAIAKANTETPVTVEKRSRTVAEWLIWRREVSAQKKAHLESLANALAAARQQAAQKGVRLRDQVTPAEATPNDLIVNLSEKSLTEEREAMEKILGDLDGQLSLKNATVVVTWN